jgi:hypothetical protein
MLTTITFMASQLWKNTVTMVELDRASLIRILVEIPIVAPNSAVVRCQLCGELFDTIWWQSERIVSTFVCPNCHSATEDSIDRKQLTLQGDNVILLEVIDRLLASRFSYCEICGAELPRIPIRRDDQGSYCLESTIDKIEGEVKEISFRPYSFFRKREYAACLICTVCFEEHLSGSEGHPRGYLRNLIRQRFFEQFNMEELQEALLAFEWERKQFLREGRDPSREAFSIEAPDWAPEHSDEERLLDFWPWSEEGIAADPVRLLFENEKASGVKGEDTEAIQGCSDPSSKNEAEETNDAKPNRFSQEGDFLLITYQGRTLPPLHPRKELRYVQVLLTGQEFPNPFVLIRTAEGAEAESLRAARCEALSREIDEASGQSRLETEEKISVVGAGAQTSYAAPLGVTGSGNGDNRVGPPKTDAVCDDEMVAQVKAQRAALQEELAQAERNNDWAIQERIQAEIEELEQYLLASLNLNGKARSDNRAWENARKNVSRKIHDAINHIDDVCDKALARHLRDSLTPVTWPLRYDPPDPTDWVA